MSSSLLILKYECHVVLSIIYVLKLILKLFSEKVHLDYNKLASTPCALRLVSNDLLRCALCFLK